MILRRAALAASVVALLWGSHAGAQPAEVPLPHPWPMRHLVADGTLTVGITAQVPPKSFSRADGSLAGTRIDLFRHLARDLGLTIRFVRLDWPAILPGLFANRFDMACEGVEWTADRLSAGGFLLTRPVALSVQVGIVRAADNVATWQALTDKRIGGVRGETEFTRGVAAVRDAIPLALPGEEEGVLALLNGQIDGLAADRVTAEALLARSPDGARLRIVPAGLPAAPESLCVNARESDLLMAVDALLASYRVDGTLSALDRAYGGTGDLSALAAIGY